MGRFLDRKFLEERYKKVGKPVKFYSEFPDTSFYEILIQNKEGEYTFKYEHSDFTNYEDEMDFWFDSEEEALQSTTARQLTSDNLEARRYLADAEYDKELARRMEINKKILKESTNKIDKNRTKDDLNQ